MVKNFPPGPQAGHPVLRAGPGGQLHEHTVLPLDPAAEGAGPAARAVLLLHLVKRMSWNRIEHLLKECVAMGRGHESLVIQIGKGKPILTDFKKFRTFLIC